MCPVYGVKDVPGLDPPQPIRVDANPGYAHAGVTTRSLRGPVRTALLLAATAFALLAASAHADLAAPRPNFPLEGNRLVLPAPITFKTGSAELTDESAKTVQYIAAYLADKTYISLLRIEGHSDNVGDTQRLTEQRALAVAKALVAKGVACARLLPVGFGASKPVADNASPEGRAKNRRIEAVNAALRGRAIGGLPTDGGGQVAGDPCK